MSLLIPSYGHGFARCAAESENPGLWDGLVGLWAPFLGPTGLTLFDWSGRKNKGTLTNMDPATDWVPSPYGWALDFSAGADRKVVLPGFSLTTNWSLAFWAWGGESAPPAPDGSMVLGKDDDDNFFYMLDGTRARFENAASANVEWGADTNFYHVWRHVVLAADATGITLYLDGVPQGRRVIAPSLELEVLGLGHTSANFDFNGRLGDVLLYYRTLMAAEARLLYADPHPLLRPRRRVFAAAAAPGGLSIPIAMHHYKQLQGAN